MATSWTTRIPRFVFCVHGYPDVRFLSHHLHTMRSSLKPESGAGAPGAATMDSNEGKKVRQYSILVNIDVIFYIPIPLLLPFLLTLVIKINVDVVEFTG